MVRPLTVLGTIRATIFLTTVLTTHALAQQDLATRKNCLAYKDVAINDANQKDVVARLTEKVLKGEGGRYRCPPMPR